jgi:septal ring factor EnvC (AmiA/AmiB activator)
VFDFVLSFSKTNIVNVQRATIAEEEPHVKTLQQDIATKEKTIFELNKKQALLQEEIHDIKQQTASTVAKGVLSSQLHLLSNTHTHTLLHCDMNTSIRQNHTFNRQMKW